MPVFVDTSAFYALSDRDDEHHARAVHAWQGLLEGDDALVTSTYVVVETLALVQGRLGFAAAKVFLDSIGGCVDVRCVGPEEHEAALQAFLLAGRRGLSFVDCSSFVLMRRNEMDRVFCFDRDFSDEGLETMP